MHNYDYSNTLYLEISNNSKYSQVISGVNASLDIYYNCLRSNLISIGNLNVVNLLDNVILQLVSKVDDADNVINDVIIECFDHIKE